MQSMSEKLLTNGKNERMNVDYTRQEDRLEKLLRSHTLTQNRRMQELDG